MKNQGEPDTEQVVAQVDQLAELGCEQIFFTGGEPFLRKDLAELFQHTHRRGIKVMVSTNGYFLDEELLQQLASIPFLQFQISLDGPEELHDLNRGKGFFKRALSFIAKCQELRISKLTVGTCFTDANVNYLDQIMRMVLDLGVEQFSPMILLPAGRATSKMDPEPDELFLNVQKMFEVYESDPRSIHLGFAHNAVLPPIFVPKHLRAQGLHERFQLCCTYPYLLGIGVKGEVAPCDGFLGWKKFVSGNANENSLTDIWHRMIASEGILQKDLKKVWGVCASCIFLEDCGGSCRAAAYAHYGSLTAPFPTCQKLYEKGLFPKDCLRHDRTDH